MANVKYWMLGVTMAALLAPVVFPTGVEAAQEQETEEKTTIKDEADFQYADEIPENAVFNHVDWLDGEVYSYAASEMYDPITSMLPLFYYYPDVPVKNSNEAWELLKSSGLMELAEQEKAAVYILNPVNGTEYGEEDYDQWIRLSKAVSGSRNLDFEYTLDHGKASLKKLFVFGEGKGADYVTDVLASDDVSSGLIAGTVLMGGSDAPEVSNYAVPAYLINSSEETVDYYKKINATDCEEETDGDIVYYNGSYVMDGGYTPKRVLVKLAEEESLTGDLVKDAWDQLLRRVWRDNLDQSNFTEGAENAVILDRPDVEALDLTFNEITGEETENTSQTRWYEWVPNEVYETMKNGTDETYPLIIVNHGNNDHEIYEAESNGWVQLAGDERVIVVAMKDIYEPGMPPESAENRYGKENAEFVRNVICEKYPVDMSRIYIAGFSIGAFVTADTSAADPSLFAAAAPMAYPADGYMQIFPYEEYGTDPSSCDLPVMYMCGKQDGGNTMKNPTDPDAAKVQATQLFFNQILTFNEMTDQLIDLEDFDDDWYPGENDEKTDKETGEVTGGYDFWDGTAAQYITQNLDFEAYPFLGYDFEAIPNTSSDTLTTLEGITYDRNIFYNEQGWPMLEFLVMGNMGHNHYTRYAQIIWKDLFSHYTRNPETGALSYDGVEAEK